MSTGVFFVYPAEGHINPTVPIIAELVRRGDRVICYAAEPFRRSIEAAGAELREYGDVLSTYHWPTSGGLLPALAARIECAEKMLPRLLADLRELRPDYLLLDAGAICGTFAGQILKVPCVSFCVAFALHDGVMGEQDFLRLLYGRASHEVVLGGLLGLVRFQETARRLDRQYGTRTPGPLHAFANPQPLNIILTSRYYQPWGDRFDDGYVFVGRGVDRTPDASEFSLERLGPQPIVLISMGTIHTDMPDFYRTCFAAFAGLPYQFVMPIGRHLNPEDLGPVPGNFLIADYVPQLSILSRCALFLSHCGSNSVHESLLHGVPMLAFPQASDHFAYAQRTVELGAGLLLAESDIRPDRMRELALQILNDPGFKEKALVIGQSLREAGGAKRAADRIVEFVRPFVGDAIAIEGNAQV